MEKLLEKVLKFCSTLPASGNWKNWCQGHDVTTYSVNLVSSPKKSPPLLLAFNWNSVK